MSFDFAGLNAVLLSRIRELLFEWLPGGRVNGNEYECGNLSGGKGKSCKINIRSGKWADFNPEDSTKRNHSGGDLISLYAAIHGLDPGPAFTQLAERYGFSSRRDISRVPSRSDPTPEIAAIVPDTASAPPFHTVHQGVLRGSWEYRGLAGQLYFVTSRYEIESSQPAQAEPVREKSYRPWTWSLTKNAWVSKAYPEPRPLYGLPQIGKQPKKPILIVEGEATADAATKLLGSIYNVVTWSGGAKATGKSDFTPIYEVDRVLLWPDSDEAGRVAMDKIAALLYPHVLEIKLVDTAGQPDGWDLADALTDGWDKSRVLEWAKPRVHIYEPPAPAKIAEIIPTSDSLAAPYEPESIVTRIENPTPTPIISSDKKYEAHKSASDHSRSFAEYLKDRLIYDLTRQRWYKYDIIWRLITDGDAESYLVGLLDDSYGKYSPTWLNGMLRFLKIRLGKSPAMNAQNVGVEDTWNTRRELFPMKNGVLNLNTGELSSHGPSLMMNWCVPYEYIPGADCPTIRAFIDNLGQGNPDAARLALYYLWAILHGRADLQRYLELIGLPGTGKSTYIQIATNLVGRENVVPTTLRQLSENRFETANLYTKRLAIISDADRWAGSMEIFKAITGQDPIRFEEKGKQQGPSFVFGGMVLVAGNRPIQSNEQSTAIVRRRLSIHLDKLFPDEQRDPDLLFKLSVEMPGLVNWLISLNADEIIKTIKESKSDRAMLETDSVADWLEENVIYAPGLKEKIGCIERDKNREISNADDCLYPNFIRFLEGKQEFSRISDKDFSARVVEILKLKGYEAERKRYTKGWFIKNIRLRGEGHSDASRLISKTLDDLS